MASLLMQTVAHFTRPSFRPKPNNQPIKKFLRGWLLVLAPKEGLVNCATVCIKSEVLLLYMPSTFYRKTEPTMCCLILTQPEVQYFHVYCSPDPTTETTNLYCTAEVVWVSTLCCLTLTWP